LDTHFTAVFSYWNVGRFGGIGGIILTIQNLRKFVGIVALILFCFQGVLDTNWSSIKPVLKEVLHYHFRRSILQQYR